jgi:hypothetical protein
MPTRTTSHRSSRPSVLDAARDEISLDSPRVRFNWGFHDATADEAAGRPARDMSGHSCRPYAAGYLAGLQAMVGASERPETSEPAWLAHVAGAGST